MKHLTVNFLILGENLSLRREVLQVFSDHSEQIPVHPDFPENEGFLKWSIPAGSHRFCFYELRKSQHIDNMYSSLYRRLLLMNSIEDAGSWIHGVIYCLQPGDPPIHRGVKETFIELGCLGIPILIVHQDKPGDQVLLNEIIGDQGLVQVYPVTDALQTCREPFFQSLIRTVCRGFADRIPRYWLESAHREWRTAVGNLTSWTEDYLYSESRPDRFLKSMTDCSEHHCQLFADRIGIMLHGMIQECCGINQMLREYCRSGLYSITELSMEDVLDSIDLPCPVPFYEALNQIVSSKNVNDSWLSDTRKEIEILDRHVSLRTQMIFQNIKKRCRNYLEQ